MAGLPWDPDSQINANTAAGILSKMTIGLSRNLNPDVLRPHLAEAVWVRYQTGGRLSPVKAIRGQIRVAQGAEMVWVMLDDANIFIRELAEVGGLVTIEVDCDWLIDDQGLPFSSSSAAFGGAKHFTPGGRFRTWMRVGSGA